MPTDPELFARTAPHWNCVDYPGEGMHYTPPGHGCVWCGKTLEQIRAERAAQEGER
jgi:hypothetical protein